MATSSPHYGSHDQAEGNAYHRANRPHTGGLMRHNGALVFPGNTFNAVYVSDLNWWTSDQHLVDECTKAGIKVEKRLVFFSEHKVNGKSKGVAFIETASPSDAATLKAYFEANLVQNKRFTAEVAAGGHGQNPFKTLPKEPHFPHSSVSLTAQAVSEARSAAPAPLPQPTQNQSQNHNQNQQQNPHHPLPQYQTSLSTAPPSPSPYAPPLSSTMHPIPMFQNLNLSPMPYGSPPPPPHMMGMQMPLPMAMGGMGMGMGPMPPMSPLGGYGMAMGMYGAPYYSNSGPEQAH